MTEDEQRTIVKDAEQRVRERCRSILLHGQGKGLDPLAEHLAFVTNTTRVEALQILASAHGCLDQMVETEIARRAAIAERHRQQLVESAGNITPLRRASHE